MVLAALIESKSLFERTIALTINPFFFCIIELLHICEASRHETMRLSTRCRELRYG